MVSGLHQATNGMRFINQQLYLGQSSRPVNGDTKRVRHNVTQGSHGHVKHTDTH